MARWRGLADRDAERVAREAAETAGAELVEVGRRGGADRRGRYALFRRDGDMYGLVPGGHVEVGYDGGRFAPSPGQLASYAASYEEYGGPGGLPRDVREYVDAATSPPRTADVPPMLVAVRARDAGLTRVAPDHPLITEFLAEHAPGGREVRVTWPPGSRPARQARIVLDGAGTVTEAWLMYSLADDVARMASAGMRPLTPDEWEHACGAGASTLFRWGDDCPSDRYPSASLNVVTREFEPATGPQLEPNAFGLHIADDPYRAERTADPGVICGGDGGGTVCGGAGFFLGWFCLATSYRDAAGVPPEEGNVLVRPAIPLT